MHFPNSFPPNDSVDASTSKLFLPRELVPSRPLKASLSITLLSQATLFTFHIMAENLLLLRFVKSEYKTSEAGAAPFDWQSLILNHGFVCLPSQ